MADTEIFRASHRFARISARKARLVVDLIRGEPVEKALSKLNFSQKRASPMVRKVIHSAMANATQKQGLEAESLVVYKAFVDEGPTLKRWRPRSMGRAYPRLKRTCHISVALKEREDTKKEDKKAVPATEEVTASPAPVDVAEEQPAEKEPQPVAETAETAAETKSSAPEPEEGSGDDAQEPEGKGDERRESSE